MEELPVGMEGAPTFRKVDHSRMPAELELSNKATELTYLFKQLGVHMPARPARRRSSRSGPLRPPPPGTR